MKRFSLFFMAAALWMSACNNPSSPSARENHSAASTDNEAHASTNMAKVEAITVAYKGLNDQTSRFARAIVGDYMNIKAALVNSNERGAAKAALTLNEHLKSFDKSFFTIAQKKEFDNIEGNLRNASADLATQDLENQRKGFKILSDNMYQFARSFETGEALYKEYCPMFEGGSAWLSKAQEIQNPYYGDKMMKCGSVIAVIQ